MVPSTSLKFGIRKVIKEGNEILPQVGPEFVVRAKKMSKRPEGNVKTLSNTLKTLVNAMQLSEIEWKMISKGLNKGLH